MVLDALRGYVELANGLTDVSRQRAVAEAKALLSQRGAFEQLLSEQAKGFADDVGRQVQTVADEILATSKANREVLLALIRAEAERAVGSLGLATADEIAALRRKIDRLEREAAGTAPGASSAAKKSAAKKSTTKGAAPKPAVKKASAPKPAAKKASATKTAATKSAAKKSAKAPAKRAATSTGATKKSAATKGTQ